MGGERRRRGLASAPRQPGARAPTPALLRPPSPTSLTPTLAGRDQGALVPRFEADAALAPRRDRVGVDVAVIGGGVQERVALHGAGAAATDGGGPATAGRVKVVGVGWRARWWGPPRPRRACCAEPRHTHTRRSALT